VGQIRQTLPPGTPIEVWFQDEMRVGQKNKLTYRWAKKGSRPRAVHDQRTQSTYLFGAVCPERGTGAALVLPACNREAMQLHLDEIAPEVSPGAHAILILDRAGSGMSEMLLGTLSALAPCQPARCRYRSESSTFGIFQWTKELRGTAAGRDAVRQNPCIGHSTGWAVLSDR
jgi:putative transposase